MRVELTFNGRIGLSFQDVKDVDVRFLGDKLVVTVVDSDNCEIKIVHVDNSVKMIMSENGGTITTIVKKLEKMLPLLCKVEIGETKCVETYSTDMTREETCTTTIHVKMSDTTVGTGIIIERVVRYLT